MDHNGLPVEAWFDHDGDLVLTFPDKGNVILVKSCLMDFYDFLSASIDFYDEDERKCGDDDPYLRPPAHFEDESEESDSV